MAAVAAVAVVAAACDVQLPGAEVLESPDAVAGAKAGGTLRVAVVQPAGVDPLDAYEPGAMLISSLICEPLVQVDPTTGELVPGLAKKVQVAGDGTTVTIELPRGVVTHDGSPLEADDLLATYSRLASPANASRVRSLLEPVQGYEEIAVDLLADGDERLAGVIALNDLSVQINLVDQDPGFLQRLAHPAMAPISSEAVTADPRAFRNQPVCAGPYMLTEPFAAGSDSLVLARFDGYHGANPAFTSGGVGYADSIEFRFFPDQAGARRAFEDAQVDVLHLPGTAAASPPAGTLVQGPAPTVEFIGFPIGLEGPFVEAEVRRTVSGAIDRRELVDRVWDGALEPATSFFPPALALVHEPDACASVPAEGGGDATLPPDVADLYPAAPGYAAALGALAERVRKFMEQGGVPTVQDWELWLSEAGEGFGDQAGMLPINVNADDRNILLALELARQWHDAFGIASVPVVSNWRDYSRTATEGQGFAGAFRTSWSTFGGTEPTVTVTDPQTYLMPMFGSTSTGIGNWARWTNREFDLDLTHYTIPEGDDQTRNQLYQDLERILCDELPLIPLAFGTSTWVVDDAWSLAIEPAVGSHDGQLLLRELFRR